MAKRKWLIMFLFFIFLTPLNLRGEEEELIPETNQVEIKEPSEKRPVTCQFCERRCQYWKFFPHKIEHLVEENRLGIEFILIPIIIILYVITTILIYKGRQNKPIRRAVQSCSLLILGLIFIQCLCNVKELTIGVRELFKRKYLLALGTSWMAILTTILVLLLRKKFRKVYCFWICPLGFAQELMGEIKLYRRKSKALKLTVLIILGVCLLLGVFLARPYQPLRDAGILLVGLLIIISILSLLFPQWKPLFGKFKYLSLIFWVGINIRNKISGPWCAIAVANITYPVIVEFIIVLAISLVVHRAWCEYTCPDGGFFELLSGKIKKRQKGKGVE